MEIIHTVQHKVLNDIFNCKYSHDIDKCSFCLDQYNRTNQIYEDIPLKYNKIIPNKINRIFVLINFCDTNIPIYYFDKYFQCEMIRMLTNDKMDGKMMSNKQDVFSEITSLVSNTFVNNTIILYFIGQVQDNKFITSDGSTLSFNEIIKMVSNDECFKYIWIIVDSPLNISYNYKYEILDNEIVLTKSNEYKFIENRIIIIQGNSIQNKLFTLFKNNRGRCSLYSILKLGGIRIYSNHVIPLKTVYFSFG